MVAPAALIAGLVWRGRVLVRQIKWELVLLLLVLLLSMIPTAGLVSVEFSLVAIFSFRSRDLRGRGPASATGISDRGYSGAGSRRFGTAIAMLMLRYNWFVRFSADVDLSWIGGVLVLFGSSRYAILNFRSWAPAAITFCALLATYLCIPTNGGVPSYNFSQELLKPAPLDPARLYLSVYPWAELTYCVSNKPQPVGQTFCGREAHSMWGGLRFHQWLQPDPAGWRRP